MTNEKEQKAQRVRDRLANEHLTYLAWCAQRGLDPEARQGEGYWTEFWDDGGATFPPFSPEQHVHEWRYFASASSVSPVAEKCDGCGEFRVIPPGKASDE